MESIACLNCIYVQIGVTCGMEEMKAFANGIFKPTARRFAVTEVYVPQGDDLKLVQFSFTALVY